MCNITSGISKECAYGVGGNTVEVYIGNATGVTMTVGTNNIVTNLSGSFQKFEVSQDSLIDTDTMTIGASDNRFFEHKVAFKVASESNTVLQGMSDLGLARTVAVVRSANDTFKVYGGVPVKKSKGLRTMVNTFTSGGAAGDEFGYTIEMMENFPNPHYVLSGSLGVTGSGPYTFA